MYVSRHMRYVTTCARVYPTLSNHFSELMLSIHELFPASMDPFILYPRCLLLHNQVCTDENNAMIIVAYDNIIKLR